MRRDGQYEYSFSAVCDLMPRNAMDVAFLYNLPSRSRGDSALFRFYKDVFARLDGQEVSDPTRWASWIADSLGNLFSSFASVPSLASLVVIRACHLSSSKFCCFGDRHSLVIPFGLSPFWST